MKTPYLALPESTTPAVCILSNHGGPLTTSPGLPISRWWSRVSPVLFQHCATGIGASSPVHAAVVAPRSDWTAPSETSSAEHPCRHDNLPIFQQGCVCRRVGWRTRFSCFRWQLDDNASYIIATLFLVSRFSEWAARLICLVSDPDKCQGQSATIRVHKQLSRQGFSTL